jgi:hypothetical protein
MDTLWNMVFRRLGLTSIAFALCVLVAVAVPAAAGGSTLGCAPACGNDAPSLQSPVPSVQSPVHPAPEQCMRNPSCGGGVALGLGAIAGIGMLAAAVPAIGASLLSRRRRPLWMRPLLGRLSAGGLFRPPRLLLDV